jgi:hypothetical protein
MEGPDHLDPENTPAVRAHRAAVLAAEGVKQTALAAAGLTQKQSDTAFVNF